MDYKPMRGTIFCKVTNIILSKIKKHRSINLVQLKRTLCSKFGSNYFRNRYHLYILMNVMEYLFYTKRLSLSAGPKEQLHIETEMIVNSLNSTVIFSKFIILILFIRT